jgi:hypothetical protein
MSKQPTHFMEQIKTLNDSAIKTLPAQPMYRLKESERVNEQYNVNVIAVFKIYKHAKRENAF